MPVCGKCGNTFPNMLDINGQKKKVGNRKYCLDCSPWGWHNTKRIDKEIISPQNKECICYLCNKKYIYHPHTGCSTKTCGACYQRGKKKQLKEKLVAYKGSKCMICGYDKCCQALDFHHTDRANKDFHIASNMNRSLEFLMKELDKCILLCANCHREVEAGITNVP